LESDNFSKIAVIGASSMVGSRFCELFNYQKSLIKADLNGQNQVDITSSGSVGTFFKNHDFQYVILFSAFTDVDAAEKQRNDNNASCWQINVEGVKNVIEQCSKTQRKLIFISTDFVFDGQKAPYSENAKRGGDLEKISWYGITKVKAEEEIEKSLKDHIIVRIAYPYRANFPTKADFARQILERYRENSLYPMFTDQTFTPTFIDDLARAFEVLINNDKSGIFHITSPSPVTPYDFAQNLLTVFGLGTKNLEKGSLKEFLKDKAKTPRPVNSSLLTQKIENIGFRPTDWRSGIKAIYSQSHKN
jgi:dTDP-4-dehydrorhamnose reductase